jgi:aerobic carbon-monoxide dehydrogenase medium subunit
LKDFEYFAPQSLLEACSLLEERGDGAKALAGGQSLIPIMKLGLADVTCIVDLKKIPNLNSITRNGKEVAIGALATHSDVASSQMVRDLVPLLAETARKIGHTQIRNRGTIGGSLCHCDPSADLPPTMLSLEANFVLQRKDGKTRKVRASEFFQGVFTTALQRGELLKEVRIPIPAEESGYSFQKLTMPMGGFAMVLVSTLLHIEKGIYRNAAVSIGGVTEVPFRATNTENTLIGKKVGDQVVSSAASRSLENVKMMQELEYPQELVTKLAITTTRRSLAGASRSESR